MQRILSYMRKAIEEYNMIEENDKIAVCLSGGKDSITLLHAFKALQRFYPKKFELIAISINPGFEFFDTTLLQNLCDNLEIPLFIEKTHAKEIVFDIRKEKNPCSLCANLRRGAINSVAVREGCNKIALGHNQDDVLETFLLNLFYTGSIGTFSPVSHMDRTGITLIRPLVYTPEKETKRFVKKNNLTVIDNDYYDTSTYIHQERRHADSEDIADDSTLHLPYLPFKMYRTVLLEEMAHYPHHTDQL